MLKRKQTRPSQTATEEGLLVVIDPLYDPTPEAKHDGRQAPPLRLRRGGWLALAALRSYVLLMLVAVALKALSLAGWVHLPGA